MDCDGIGAFFYQPPIMITENKEQRDNLLSKSKSLGHRIRRIVLNHRLKNNIRVLVTDDGFLGVFENNITYALKIINTTFATGITWGLGNEYVRKQDLCRFSLVKEGSYIHLDRIGGPSERNMFSFQREGDTGLHDWSLIEPRRIPMDDIRRILDRSYEYLAIQDSNKNLYADLMLLLDGFTLYYRGAYRGAYIYGWMIIETVIDHIWKEYVTGLKITSDDKKNLKLSSQWTSQHKSEVLFASGKMDPKHRNLLKKLRKKRNDIMHEKQAVSSEEAFRCLRPAAVTAPNRMLGNTDIFHDPKEKQFEETWYRNRAKVVNTD